MEKAASVDQAASQGSRTVVSPGAVGTTGADRLPGSDIYRMDPAALAAARRRRRIRQIAWNSLPPLTFVAVLGIWAAVVPLFHIPSYLVPSPGSVFGRIISDFPTLWTNARLTVFEIIVGFALSIVVAIPLGLLIALSPLAKQLVYPPVMLLQLVPKIAVAPLFVVWLGFGNDAKILLTLLMSFFPLLLASISAFRILDDRLLYLTRSMGASRWQTFRHLRFPAALPVIFAGLKTSATIAVTAALVAEFVASNSGLGYLLLQGTTELDTTLIFAVLVVLTIVGIIINYLVELAEWLLTPWQRVKST